jgi:hypothetical protein
MRTHRNTVVAAALALAVVAPSMGASAQGEPPGSLGASTPAFVDTFDEPGLWGLPDAHGSTEYADGAIEMSLDSEGWMWGWRDLASTHHPVLRVQGTVAVDGDGAAGGWMCGTPSSAFAFGIMDQDGGWQIGQVIETTVTVVASGQVPGSVRADGDAGDLLDVECGQVSIDVTQVLLSVNGVPVGTANVAAIGPFGKAAFVGTSATGDPATITFDDAAVWTGARYARSDDPGPTAGPIATPRAVDTVLGADTVAFEDDFTTEGQWGTGASAEAFVSYQDDQLAITVLTPDASRWSWHRIAAPAPVLRVEGPVTLGPTVGSAGWMCGGDDDTPDFLLGVVTTEDRWVVGDIIDGSVRTLDSGDLDVAPDRSGAPRDLVLECGDVDEESSRVVLWVDGEQVADLSTTAAMGPYDKAAAFASAVEPPFNARFDDVTVRTGADRAPAAP